MNQRTAVERLLGHSEFTIVNCQRLSGDCILLDVADFQSQSGYKVKYNPWLKIAEKEDKQNGSKHQDSIDPNGRR